MKKGAFTLIELIVVIAIIWILFLATANFDLNKGNDMAKKDRLANSIMNIVKSEATNSLIWRSIKNTATWKRVNYDYSKLTITYWWINMAYFDKNYQRINSPWPKFWETILKWPFYWDPEYSIHQILMVQSNGGLAHVPAAEITFQNWKISILWALQDGSLMTTAVELRLAIWYKGDFKRLSIDGRTWAIWFFKDQVKDISNDCKWKKLGSSFWSITAPNVQDSLTFLWMNTSTLTYYQVKCQSWSFIPNTYVASELVTSPSCQNWAATPEAVGALHCFNVPILQ